MLVLILAYIIINRSGILIFGAKNNIINYLSLFILAFSYIFWNQSIEAKGGIYILNLLFLAILVYLILKISEKFRMKYLYMISYIYGLSLTNHWPSMIILFPIFAFLYYKYSNRFKAKQMAINMALFILGLTAYIYLPIRGCVEGVYVFMAKPDTWDNFWWTILRSGYINSLTATTGVYKYQFGEFLNLLVKDYYILLALIIPGIYALWKRKKDVMFFFLSIFLITVGIVIFVNCSDEKIVFVVDNFLLQAQFICFILIAIGMFQIFELLKIKKFRNIFIALLICVTIFNLYDHFKMNNSRNNYLSYDFGNNVVKTIGPNSLYLAEDDKYLMPMLYIQNTQHISNDIQTFSPFEIRYAWQNNSFVQNNELIDPKDKGFIENVTQIISSFIDKKTIYFSSAVKISDQLTSKYKAQINGLLFEIIKSDMITPSEIFKIYSYRGIYDTNSKYDSDLLYLYGARMAMHADELFLNHNYSDSIQLYHKALLFFEKAPSDEFVTKADIYYNLAGDYAYTYDTANQLHSLLKAIECDPKYWQAYEDAGRIYFVNKNPIAARDMFQKAINNGSSDVEELSNCIIQINNYK
jgi:hypothetical protein